MYVHFVIKHIRCKPCDYVIDVRKFSMTADDKELRDRVAESMINNRSLLGFPICPKCKHKAQITDPPIVFVGEDGDLIRDADGNPVSKYTDQLDMSKVSFDGYGFARHSDITEIL